MRPSSHAKATYMRLSRRPEAMRRATNGKWQMANGRGTSLILAKRDSWRVIRDWAHKSICGESKMLEAEVGKAVPDKNRPHSSGSGGPNTRTLARPVAPALARWCRRRGNVLALLG